jgi:cephalosporin hydroxylase
MEELLDMPLRNVLSIIQEGIINQATYFGVGAQKSPMDAWVYQEIMYETMPDVIIEIGTSYGGGTLFLAHLCDLLGKGRIIGLDLSHKNVPEDVKTHPRISFVEGDACQNFEYVEKMISKDDRVLIIEDSSHTYDNTLNVLRLYSRLIKLGDYFIVEDSICHHGLVVGPNPGPYEAIETFVTENKDFEIDRTREHFLITWNPKGYLRRTALNNTQFYATGL